MRLDQPHGESGKPVNAISCAAPNRLHRKLRFAESRVSSTGLDRARNHTTPEANLGPNLDAAAAATSAKP